MSTVIQFLEAAGRGVALAPIDYETAVASLDIDDEQRKALFDCDPAALNDLLDGRLRMMCVVHAPQEEHEHESIPDDDGTTLPDEEGFEVDPSEK